MKNKTGITLIALVITIIVLLILAGISISAIMGDNGIAAKAKDAKTNTEIAKVKEIADIIAAEYVAETEGEQATAYYIITELVERNYIEESQIVDNGQYKEQGIIKVEGKEVIIKGAIDINLSLEYLTIASDGTVNVINRSNYYTSNFPLEELIIPEEIDGITVKTLGNHMIGQGIKVLELPATIQKISTLTFTYATDLEELRVYSNLSDTINSLINAGYLNNVKITCLDIDNYLGITDDGEVYTLFADAYYNTSPESFMGVGGKIEFPFETLKVPEEIDEIQVTSLEKNFVIGKGVKVLELPKNLNIDYVLNDYLLSNRIASAPDLEEIRLYKGENNNITSIRGVTITYLD